ASNMDRLASLRNSDIYAFKYLTKPKEVAIAELKRLLEILDLPTGMVVNSKELEKGLDKILAKTSRLAKLSIKCKTYMNQEPKLWGELLFPEHIKSLHESKINVVLDE